MPTPFEDLYTAAKAVMTSVNALTSQTVSQAPTNMGDDFRVASGEVEYQIQIAPEQDSHRGSVQYPRARCTIRLHHYAASLANEETFEHITMSHFADEFMERSKWSARAGVHGLDIDEDPEISDGEREGNVISFEATATVLMDAV